MRAFLFTTFVLLCEGSQWSCDEITGLQNCCHSSAVAREYKLDKHFKTCDWVKSLTCAQGKQELDTHDVSQSDVKLFIATCSTPQIQALEARRLAGGEKAMVEDPQFMDFQEALEGKEVKKWGQGFGRKDDNCRVYANYAGVTADAQGNALASYHTANCNTDTRSIFGACALITKIGPTDSMRASWKSLADDANVMQCWDYDKATCLSKGGYSCHHCTDPNTAIGDCKYITPPSKSPTKTPTKAPTLAPTKDITSAPTPSPTKGPTRKSGPRTAETGCVFRESKHVGTGTSCVKWGVDGKVECYIDETNGCAGGFVYDPTSTQ